MKPNVESLPPSAKRERLRVLISAYACEPGKGSELGIGWGTVNALSELHDLTVLTRSSNRETIESEPNPNCIQFVYYDLPKALRWWKKGARGVQIYYFLWQLGVRRILYRLLEHEKFDICQHLTWGRCWMPCVFYSFKMPYIFGPVGGVEKTPLCLRSSLPTFERLKEAVRDCAIIVVGKLPPVRKSIVNAACILAATEDAMRYVKLRGAVDVRLVTNSGISNLDYNHLSGLKPPPPVPVRFFSMGRLIAWKGFHLGLKAFAASKVENAEYWIVGDGPERKRLEKLAKKLGIAKRVRFWGWVERHDALCLLEKSHALVHPSFHDSGGLVCAEAMAARRPVICLNLGGPAVQVTEEAGYIIDAVSKSDVIYQIADAMKEIVLHAGVIDEKGSAGQREVFNKLIWSSRALYLSRLYQEIIDRNNA